MIKESYVTPTANVDVFAPNDYIAACSDKGTTTYNFVCNAAAYWLIDIGGNVYLETNGVEGLQKYGNNADKYLGPHHACEETHTVTVPIGTNVDDIFQYGYFDPANLFISTKNVRVWTDGGTNIHCSANLKSSDYVPVKS